MRLFGRFLLFLLIAFPASLLQTGQGVAHAQEDEVLEDEAIADVESEDELDDVQMEEEADEATTTEEAEEDEEEGPKKSPDVDTNILFVKPLDSQQLPAGSIVHFLVGFTNNGKGNFIVNNMDAAFRYPQDFSYYIQNFSAYTYDKVVEPKRHATFEYSFIPSENFNSRPFGLTVNLNYQDSEGKLYQDAVFNETVMITDPIEGFDAETFFMWVTLAGLILLVLVILQQTVFSSASRRLTSKPKVEMGTQSNNDIDYDWIPKESLPQQRRQSPRRRTKGSSGSGDE